MILQVQRGAGRTFLCLKKKSTKKINKYALYLLSKYFSNLLLAIQVKPKFLIVTFFLIPTMAEAALEALILLMYLWFFKFEQKSIRIVKTWTILLWAIDTADSNIATFTTTFTNVAMCCFYNLQWSFLQ